MPTKTSLILVLILFAAAVGGAAESGQRPGDTTVGAVAPGQDRAAPRVAEALDDYLSAYASAGLFSGSVLVAHKGQIVLRKGYGLADREHDIPNTPESRFDIASVAKTFTSTAVLILADRKKLRLDDPICKYLDACPPQWQSITIQHLLTHTSGIRNYTVLPDFYEYRALASYLPKAMDQIRNMPLDFAPGERFSYSNTGYVLLHSIVEKVTGQSFEEFLEREILVPLGMKGTGFLIQPGIRHVIVPGRAMGYTDGRGPIENAPWVYPDSGGGLYSTVDDLYRFDRALNAGKLLVPATMEAALTPLKGNYGFGWFVFKTPIGRLATHGGNIPGYAINFSRYLDEGLTIIILSNLDTAPTGPMSDGVRAVLLGQPYSKPKAYKEIDVRAETLGQYVGRYRDTTSERPQVWTITQQVGRLWVRQGDDPGETETVLHAFGPDLFVNRTFAIYEIAFQRDKTGHITGFIAPGPWGKGEFIKIE